MPEVHAERLAIARNRRADAAIAENAECLVSQRGSHTDLPVAGLERCHLLRQLARGCENERPSELGSRIGRRAGVLARGHDDAQARAGFDVDMWINAALADQFEPGEPFEQGIANFRALADKHNALGLLQARSKRIAVLHVIVPDRDLMAVQLVETREGAQRVEVIVKNCNLHASRSVGGTSSREHQPAKADNVSSSILSSSPS
jgi:hypothetical protein